MASRVELIAGEGKPDSTSEGPTWFKVGMLTAFSAVAGGMAAAWYYRKTLLRLRQAEDLQQSERTVPSTAAIGDDL
jgi:hypothetical protein